MKKVILITGSSTGFGALMVRTFSQQGHQVIATMRNIGDKNAEAAKTLGNLSNTEVLEIDVTDEDSITRATDYVYSKYGRIDVLVNNAGVYGGGILEGFSVTQLQKLFDVNVWGTVRMNNHILPGMRAAKNGLIITVSSTVGRVSPPFQAPYNATKFALEALIESSYEELIDQGVESVLIEPGAFLTEIMGKPGFNADREGIQDAYGEKAVHNQQKIQAAFMKIFTESAPNPQLVADATLILINMEKGKRPLRTPVDPSAKGVDIEYNKVTEEMKLKWLSAYGL